MTIGLFVDGSFVYKSFPDHFDYLKLRQLIEKELNDTVDEAYYFNSDDDPRRQRSSITTSPFRRRMALDFG